MILLFFIFIFSRFERWGTRHGTSPENSSLNMYYGNGDACWNGPIRSVEIQIICGKDIRALSVTEESKCEYSAVLSAPAACDIEQLNSLKRDNRLENPIKTEL